MSPLNFTHILTQAVDELSESSSYKGLFHQHTDGTPLPSARALQDIVELSRAILFPGYFGNSTVNSRTIKYHIGVNIERLFDLLTGQVLAGLCFTGDDECAHCTELQREEAARIAARFISRLPEMRRILATEMAHSETGIDIHPGAAIGSYFTIDHGTGVVIGETCIIGSNVKLYQGVTLGAKSFPLDEDGKPIKGIPRHPILEDNVIVYSNATILGRITIGRGATVGGNIWVTEDVPAGARIVQTKAKK